MRWRTKCRSCRASINKGLFYCDACHAKRCCVCGAMTPFTNTPLCAKCIEAKKKAPKSIPRNHFDEQDAKEVWAFCALCDAVRVGEDGDTCRLCTMTTLGWDPDAEEDDEVAPEVSSSEDDEPDSSDERKPEVPKKHDERDGRRNLVNFYMPVGVRLGVVTWNVAHFGEGPLDLRRTLGQLCRQLTDFLKKNNASSFTSTFVDYLDDYERWACFWKDSKCAPDKAALAELRKAEVRHRGEVRPKKRVDEDEDEEGDEGGGELEKREEANDSDVPEVLRDALHEAWRKFDAGPPRTRKKLRKLWGGYFEDAFTLLDKAYEVFEAEWGVLRKEQFEAQLHEDVLADVVALVDATKALRAAAKMVVLPVLQLRLRANLANKVQAGAEVPKSKSDKKGHTSQEEALKTAQDALERACKASRWAVGPTLSRVVLHDQMLHRVLIARHVVLMFQKNEWLDAIALQEVNKGVGTLIEYLDQHGIDCFPGFKMASRSGAGSQTEYYPLAVRRGGRIADVQSLWAYYNTTGNGLDSQVIVNELRQSKDIDWSKGKGIYRPILGFNVRVSDGLGGDRVVRIGVVHTSPAGNEMNRPDVFAQVERPLAELSTGWHPVVVGGDYYLAAEAVTANLTSLSSEHQALARQTKQEQLAGMRPRLKRAKKKLDEAQQSLKAARERAPESSSDEEPPSDTRKKRKLNQGEAQQKTQKRAQEEELQGRVKKYEKKVANLSRAIETVDQDTDLVQFIRNDPSIGISVESKIGALGLEVGQPLAGTNWKSKTVVARDRAQVADFFVYSGAESNHLFGKWLGARVGLVNPSGGLRIIDGWELQTAKYWRRVSDHFPVGIVLSMKANDPWLERWFVDAWRFSPWVPSLEAPVQRLPREVLGIVNPGNTCYVNAALQLVARIGLAASYVVGHGQPQPPLKSLAETVQGILIVRAAQGQNATYAGGGMHRRYTTAMTEGLRVELYAHHVVSGVGTQEDAVLALEGILDAFDRFDDAFSPNNQEHLRLALEQQDFAAKRPSKLHFILETKTLYALGDEGMDIGDDVIRVDADAFATHRSCERFFRVNLPEDPRDEDDDRSGHEKLREEMEDEAVTDDRWAPLDFGTLVTDMLNVEYPEAEGEERVRVRGPAKVYNGARKRRETTTVKAAPDHWLVVLNRFGWSEDMVDRKKARKVDVPLVFNGKALCAFVVHIGAGSNEGHYVAYVQVGGLWYHVDDERVHDGVDVSQVKNDAYLLYYE